MDFYSKIMQYEILDADTGYIGDVRIAFENNYWLYRWLLLRNQHILSVVLPYPVYMRRVDL